MKDDRILSDNVIGQLQTLASETQRRFEEMDQKKIDEVKALIEKIRVICAPTWFNPRIVLRDDVLRRNFFFLLPANGKVYFVEGIYSDEVRGLQDQRMRQPNEYTISRLAQAKEVPIEEALRDGNALLADSTVSTLSYGLERILKKREWERGTPLEEKS